MYAGQVGSNQIHDYDPGIVAAGKPNAGLFWTVAFPDDSVEAEVSEAKARFHASHVSMPDYGTIVNGLFHTAPPKPGHVSFDIRWFGAVKTGSVSNNDLKFGFDYVQTHARISWEGRTGEDHFHSDDDHQTVEFAQIANEKNGAFFGK